MKPSVLTIAAREAGISADRLFLGQRIEDVFSDSLDWLEFIHCVRNELGPVSDEAATKAETFSDLADALRS
jgi:phosphopantetheine binding protein